MIFEIWKPVVGYEGIYSVSDLGRVRGDKEYKGFFSGRILKPLYNQRYFSVGLYKHGKQKSYRIHYLVITAFLGPRPKGKTINHKDGIKSNNRLSNLEYCTQKENIIHSHRTKHHELHHLQNI